MFQFYKIYREGDIKDAFILEYIRDTAVSANEKIKYVMREDGRYVWVDYSTMLESMPYIQISSKGNLSERICSMEKVGLLKSTIVGRSKYIKITQIVDTLYYNVTSDEVKDFFESLVPLREQSEENRSAERTISDGIVPLREPTNQLYPNQLFSKQEERNSTQARAYVGSLEEREKEIQHQPEVKLTETKEINSSVKLKKEKGEANATKLQEQPTPIEAKFNEFWFMYPKTKRVKKAQTMLNFKKEVGKNIEKADEIINSLKKQIEIDKIGLDFNLTIMGTKYFNRDKIFLGSFKESYTYLKEKDYELDWENRLEGWNRDNPNFIKLFKSNPLTKTNNSNNPTAGDAIDALPYDFEPNSEFLTLLDKHNLNS